MTEGHCLICPLQHHCSATGLDEDVWSEIQVSQSKSFQSRLKCLLWFWIVMFLLCHPQLFRRTLVRMFESQDLDCVFMETHLNPRQRRHMVLECIPLPRELGDMAPIYFKVCIFTYCPQSGEVIMSGVTLGGGNTTVRVCFQKAIMECDEEWAMNKKVVDLSSKHIRQAVSPLRQQ